MGSRIVMCGAGGHAGRWIAIAAAARGVDILLAGGPRLFCTFSGVISGAPWAVATFDVQWSPA